MTAAHTSKVFEQELHTLQDKIARMGTLAEEMVRQGMRALDSRDSELAMNTMRMDRRMNRLECEVDELCMRMLATRQPVASDLRFITMSLKVVTDLERIGDLCVNICERVLELNEEPALPLINDVTGLGTEASELLRRSVDALVRRDAERANQLLSEDDPVDAHYTRIFESVLALMSSNPDAVFRATRLQSVAKYLERVADHAANIAETVIFMVHGKDIRHRNRRQETEDWPRMPAPRGSSSGS